MSKESARNGRSGPVTKLWGGEEVRQRPAAQRVDMF